MATATGCISVAKNLLFLVTKKVEEGLSNKAAFQLERQYHPGDAGSHVAQQQRKNVILNHDNCKLT